MQLIHIERHSLNKNDLIYRYPHKMYHKEFFVAASKTEGSPLSFQSAMKVTIIIGQCFGLNPVLGISELDASKLRFTYYSNRCFYSIISIIGQSCLVWLCILEVFSDSSVSSNTTIVFYLTNSLTTVLFFHLAPKWPKLVQYIARIEATDPNLDGTIARKCNIACIVILSMALLEHMLSVVSGLAIAIDCQPDTPLYEAFLYSSFPWVWAYLPFNLLTGILVQFFNLQCTFNWNFADVFVICISIYLSSRLKQINHRINSVQGKKVASSFWRTIREDYSRTTRLVRKVDGAISSIIFTSFAINLFSICLQLLHTLDEGIKATPACHRSLSNRPFKGYEQAVYFIYSFSFLLLRFLAVSLILSRIHTASREPAFALYDVPPSVYCSEIQRFLDQVHSNTVALSGLQFFNVKRGLVLTIAGTIVTYELVLLQFAGVTPTVTPTTTAEPMADIVSSSASIVNSTELGI